MYVCMEYNQLICNPHSTKNCHMGYNFMFYQNSGVILVFHPPYTWHVCFFAAATFRQGLPSRGRLFQRQAQDSIHEEQRRQGP